jgi:hypothetical protein
MKAAHSAINVVNQLVAKTTPQSFSAQRGADKTAVSDYENSPLQMSRNTKKGSLDTTAAMSMSVAVPKRLQIKGNASTRLNQLSKQRTESSIPTLTASINQGHTSQHIINSKKSKVVSYKHPRLNTNSVFDQFNIKLNKNENPLVLKDSFYQSTNELTRIQKTNAQTK